MSLTSTRTARAVIYFCCIGGLLVFNSLVVMFLWNHVIPTLSVSFNHYHLNFLEGAGISAFTYVIVFAVRYGIQDRKKVGESERQREHSAMRERCSHLTPEQREALKHELITTCGCKEENERVNVEVRSGS